MPTISEERDSGSHGKKWHKVYGDVKEDHEQASGFEYYHIKHRSINESDL